MDTHTIDSPDYSTWLTKDQAAAAIGVTRRSIEQFAKDKRLRFVAEYKRPDGGPRISIYHPEDVTELAVAKHAVPSSRQEVVPATAATDIPGSSARSTTLQQRPTFLDGLREMIDAKFAEQASQLSQSVPLADLALKVYLSIPEAARLTGRTEAWLRRACQHRKLGAVKDGGWKIRRSRLQKL